MATERTGNMLSREEIKAHDELAILSFLHKLNTPDQADEVRLLAGGWSHPSEVCGDFGYGDEDFDSNGWEYDYWIGITKEGFPNLVISGSGYSGNSRISIAK